MFPFERMFKVIGKPNFALPGEEQEEFFGDLHWLLDCLEFKYRNLAFQPLPEKKGIRKFAFIIYNEYGMGVDSYAFYFAYEVKSKTLLVSSSLSERQSALVIRWLIDRFLRIKIEEQSIPKRYSFDELCAKVERDYMQRNGIYMENSRMMSPLVGRKDRARGTLQWMCDNWESEVKPALDELFEALRGQGDHSSYDVAEFFQPNRPHGYVKYNPIIKYLKTKSALEIYDARVRLSPDESEKIGIILANYDEAWQRVLSLCIRIYKSLGMELKICYDENFRTANEIDAEVLGTTRVEARHKNDVAFENLCAALKAIAKAEVDGDCIASYYNRAAAGGGEAATEIVTKIDPPDMINLYACRQFCFTLCAAVRRHLKTSIYSIKQAVEYILQNAHEGDLYYKECCLARKIKESRGWSWPSFTTYCKQQLHRKPKNIKRAAKKRAHILDRKRKLRDDFKYE